MERGIRSVSLALAVVVAVSCGGARPDQSDGGSVDGGAADGGVDGGSVGDLTLQLNDLSLLFPLPHDAQELAAASLAVSRVGDRGVLLPEAVYDAMGRMSGSSGHPPPGGIGEARYADLHVVGVRVDPCFAGEPRGSACENQLRLVVQELQPGSGGLEAFDSALHLFYRLTRDEVVAFAREVAQLREASAPGRRLGALAVHPVMVAQGLSGAFAAGVRQRILRLAGEQNLIRVTRLSARSVGFDWNFSGFDVGAGQALTPMVIPALPSGTTRQNLFSGFSTSDVSASIAPSTMSADDYSALTTGTGALTPLERDRAFAALVRVDHPRRHSPNTIDCASCHFATPIATFVAASKFGLVEASHAEAFRPDGVFVLQDELAPTFDPAGGFNVHAFSYFGRAPGISQRTVNETADLVAYFNHP